VVACEEGLEAGCEGEIGPAASETCDGKDDDCNGLTDDDTEGQCFPYLCGGVIGCLLDCHGDADCAAGNFCDAGTCRGTGANGAQCGDDGECQSGHCSGGVCCEAGLCCRSKSDCASLDDAICESAASDGCEGIRLVGVCGPQSRCTTEQQPDDAACDGEVCEPGDCDGDRVVPDAVCAASLCASTASRSCSPYGCSDAACLTRCGGDDDCTDGAVCNGSTCQSLPDGAPCSGSEACASQHCANGFCCAAPGSCCGGGDTDCAGLDGEPSCLDAATCQGTQVVGVCGDDFVCGTETVADPGACLGTRCGDAQCVNLDGGSFVLEGLKTPRCDANGVCSDSIRDCRDPDDGGQRGRDRDRGRSRGRAPR
jgi:hypothetical protein